ncbi:hypothetical protein [uncultured Dokdonia sp.]|uniref:hypothetical protein n=1 Tax=uncultured Dokdonia sp. TaxID=575653 RepID=UPI002613E1D7|nr:hypothetical protein [uncultured Dokdonia sp.]
MMKNIFTILIIQLFFVTPIIAQNKSIQKKNTEYVGEWKSYLSDKTTFQYLKLNIDGTGIKAIGKTINGKDTILSKDYSFLKITNWQIKKKRLVIQTEHNLKYKPNNVYEIKFANKDSITLLGDHFRLGIYPSRLNKDVFNRIVNYTNSKILKGDYGVKTQTCLQEIKLFEFKKIDDNFISAKYIGFDDIIPHIVGCTQDYEFVSNYIDPAYELKLPKGFDSWSLGLGNNNLIISFTDKSDTTSETSISINYDFKDENKKHYFKQIEKGKEIENKIIFANKELYQFINWQKKISGKIFYDNHIYISYYTFDKSKEQILKECISSFKYKN